MNDSSAVPAAFKGIDPDVVEAIGAFRTQLDRISVLDARETELSRISAVIALGAPRMPLETHVGRALEAGATPDEIWGVVVAVMPIVGVPRIVDVLPLVRQLVGDMTPVAK